jgi:HSP20 family protein
MTCYNLGRRIDTVTVAAKEVNPMLMRTDPFHDLDRAAQQFFGTVQPGTWTRPAAIPVDAYRTGDEFVVAFDLPGVPQSAIEIDVDRNVLTVKAERRPLDLGDDTRVQFCERPLGVFSRQMLLGEGLDTERIQARYVDGVLLVKIPVAEHAKPRKIAVGSGVDNRQKAISA